MHATKGDFQESRHWGKIQVYSNLLLLQLAKATGGYREFDMSAGYAKRSRQVGERYGAVAVLDIPAKINYTRVGATIISTAL